ncbi:hypothetical protein NP233_g7371 [Leucocoprinus birnbaumii]|uniref:Uncharacterized protein n=1 Tax=Leucocoprinus birnbaumii TaxID=56174 RepID=A0AAD5YUT7_9AGAR|nr:hypothetical protein NP233_g7371 [Leucocoprinus birnbaumii]
MKLKKLLQAGLLGMILRLINLRSAYINLCWKRLKLIVTSFLCLDAAVASENITLYGVVGTYTEELPVSNIASYSMSPLSVYPDGKTAYVQVEAVTAVVRIDGSAEIFPPTPTTTTEVISTPTPVTYIVNADASGYEVHFTDTSNPRNPAPAFEKCVYSDTTRAVCVDVWTLSGGATQTTLTWTGAPSPIYTLVDSELAQRTPNQTSTAQKQVKIEHELLVICLGGLLSGFGLSGLF